MTDVSMDRLAKVYRKIRDAREANTKEYKERDAKFKNDLTTLEGLMLQELNKISDDSNKASVRTDHGLVYKELKITPTGSDWDRFYKWVAENDAFDFLERRIKAASVKEYMDAHEGGVPPGVSVYREYVARVRAI